MSKAEKYFVTVRLDANKEKHKTEAKNLQNISFKPRIKTKAKQRTFQEYFTDKQSWKRQKKEAVEKKRVREEVKKLKDCTFSPILVAKYNKVNMRLIPGEKVEDRLLRSLDKSMDRL